MTAPGARPRRRFLMLAAAALLPLPNAARAEGHGGGEGGGGAYAKLPTIVVEFWGADGLFHAANMDLTVVFPSQTSVNKKVADKITNALAAMTWEDFSRGNPAETIKAVALDILHKDPASEKATEVLIQKLMLR